MAKNTNVIRIPTSLKTKFFRYWFEFLEPFHKLTNREVDVITAFVKHRYELSKVIHDENILDKVLMSTETKQQIIEECGLTFSHFQVILSKLKKSKLIINDKINPRFIPNIEEDATEFRLIMNFELK